MSRASPSISGVAFTGDDSARALRGIAMFRAVRATVLSNAVGSDVARNPREYEHAAGGQDD